MSKRERVKPLVFPIRHTRTHALLCNTHIPQDTSPCPDESVKHKGDDGRDGGAVDGTGSPALRQKLRRGLSI